VFGSPASRPTAGARSRASIAQASEVLLPGRVPDRGALRSSTRRALRAIFRNDGTPCAAAREIL